MDIVTKGEVTAPIYVICEPPTDRCHPNNPTNAESIKLFLSEALRNGFKQEDFLFIRSCEPIPVEIKKSKSKVWKHVEPYAEKVRAFLDGKKYSAIVSMGDIASRIALGRAVAITKGHGTLHEGNVFPIYSPSMCRSYLEHMPVFQSDIATLKRLEKVNYDVSLLGGNQTIRKRYVTSLQELRDLKPKFVAVDTETTGLRQTQSDFQILTVQIAYSESDCVMVPLHKNFWPVDEEYTDEKRDALVQELKEFLEDPTIYKVGQNINYERLTLDTANIHINAVLADTMLLAWCVDENMRSKDLDSLVRRYVPEIAGLNDQNNATIDKSNMINLDRDTMLDYGGNDGIMTYRLFVTLWERLKLNPRQKNLFTKLKMPGLYACYMMEKYGLESDIAYLDSIQEELSHDIDKLKQELLELVPKAVIRKHLKLKIGKDGKNGLEFSRDNFVRDILFSPEGMGLTPVVFTDTTKDSKDPKDRIPSVSTKNHLPYFKDIEGDVGDFVTGLMEYNKLDKLLTTYVRGFASKYVHEDGAFHSKYNLHITTTGRSSSSGPNSQNFISRGKWASKYKKSIKARDGYKFISADLSQVELRLVAWESQDPVMMKAYREGKDIHQITAQAVLGLTDSQWSKLTKAEKKLARFRAKAVNFGFVYDMRAKKFRSYAKTDYDVNLTEKEAQHYYNSYHNLYKGVRVWNEKRKAEARKTGQIVSLHGSIRHLPSVFSPDDAIKAQAERQAANTPIQSFGSDLGLLAIARIARQVNPNHIRVVGFIHDDVILEVKDGHEQEALSMLLWVMNNPPLKEVFGLTSPVPILAEPDMGPNLGEMVELMSPPDEKPEWWVDLELVERIPPWWDMKKDIGFKVQ